MTATINTRQNRRLQRLAEQGVRQTNVLVHDANRDSLDALRPHLASPTSKDALSRLTTALAAQQPVNVSQVRQISPFRYPGGKTWLVPVAREWLGSLGRPSVLLEPFAGGGVIGLTAAAEGLVDHVVMVELDDDVAAVWKILVNGSDRDVKILSNKVLRFDVTHDNVRAVIDSTPNRTVDMAFRTIVKNRCQRGGIMAPGAGLTKEGENGKGLSSRWYAETLVSRFAAIRSFRDRITFEHGDALEAVERYHGATMFVDPPYTAGSGKRAGKRLYTHNEVDHEKLFDLVAAHAGPAMLTYDDDPDVRALAAAHGFRVGDVAMKSTHHVVMRELAILKD
ncbi:DNA adenine methylase [Propioniferax innocua]|uniref:DNA adenine methylase n=1 Tax=Propioniferax innocua TaxID=1753 RepID=A0A542ZR21_9ACTN|nr:DNA adenine methylase [Propioniferax innocua]TQL62801.1 DNA adenine methylase [Propioniferax innocua]